MSRRKAEAEGGCGVIGIASSVPVEGRHLLQSLIQMRNRGNGKGGGAALAGLDPAWIGVDAQSLADHYLLAIAYLEPSARAQVEERFVHPAFDVHFVREFPVAHASEWPVQPPDVVAYLVSPTRSALDEFAGRSGLQQAGSDILADEFVYQNSNRLNRDFYASLGEKRAFVLSHGKDLLVLKMVGFGDDVIAAYQLEHASAHVWIGHHRYPTKGRVWHPGGAHPFVGLHEALVHNGDFANYASVCAYLAQHNIHPLFLTDTEVSVLVFDLLHRTFGYPLEYVMECLAPTTERDFALLPERRRDIYRMLQEVHIHASPDGPWFFLIAQTAAATGLRDVRLIGITDPSMLRPQVFALQRGSAESPSIGFAASEKQAIDAALASLSASDPRFGTRPDRLWNARGGSHTDGGAFSFTIERRAAGSGVLVCQDKFGQPIEVEETALPDAGGRSGVPIRASMPIPGGPPRAVLEGFIRALPNADYGSVEAWLEDLARRATDDPARESAFETLGLLMDRRFRCAPLRRRSVLALIDRALDRLVASVSREPSPGFVLGQFGKRQNGAERPDQRLILDGAGYPPDGKQSLARAVCEAVVRGYRRITIVHAHGHRFLGTGLGPSQDGLRIDVFGSPGDYLASGVDGVEVVVHGDGQDQLAQIMKAGRLVIHGDVGQTFLYAAKGGEVFVLGNAAGRPLINAVGKPHVVINGTCLDYLAESFMAGDAMRGGGFAILNGLAHRGDGALVDLDTPYPGGNLFSLASGGALFIRDPRRRVGEDQLNGGEFAEFSESHWELIRPLLEENDRLFGIPVQRLLEVDGSPSTPDRVYRVIVPATHKALQPEEAWVAQGHG
ncbi:MAG: hypothetical protein WD906_04085 [Anaerolineales bacterium]